MELLHKSDAPDPKIEANRLVNKYVYQSSWIEASNGTIVSAACGYALFAVDEILNVLDTFQRHEYAKVLIPFYQDVKKEIELI
jgi:hypothetical protein